MLENNDNFLKPSQKYKNYKKTDSSLNLNAIFEKELHSKAFEWPVWPTSWQRAENNKAYYYTGFKNSYNVVYFNIE